MPEVIIKTPELSWTRQETVSELCPGLVRNTDSTVTLEPYHYHPLISLIAQPLGYRFMINNCQSLVTNRVNVDHSPTSPHPRPIPILRVYLRLF